jgi:hypothetical protein
LTDLRRIASLLLLALLTTRSKYSVRNLLGAPGGAEERTGLAFPSRAQEGGVFAA